jgi:hypothetical protein
MLSTKVDVKFVLKTQITLLIAYKLKASFDNDLFIISL